MATFTPTFVCSFENGFTPWDVAGGFVTTGRHGNGGHPNGVGFSKDLTPSLSFSGGAAYNYPTIDNNVGQLMNLNDGAGTPVLQVQLLHISDGRLNVVVTHPIITETVFVPGLVIYENEWDFVEMSCTVSYGLAVVGANTIITMSLDIVVNFNNLNKLTTTLTGAITVPTANVLLYTKSFAQWFCNGTGVVVDDVYADNTGTLYGDGQALSDDATWSVNTADPQATQVAAEVANKYPADKIEITQLALELGVHPPNLIWMTQVLLEVAYAPGGHWYVSES